MFEWEDREYFNPRKRVFKNIDTGEILNLEIQDDPDNIKKESKTPLISHNLNLAQAELVDEIGTQTQSERAVLILQQAIQENTEYEIPVEYEVGNNSLEIYYQGTKLIKDIEYLEVGTEGTFSNKIKFYNWGQNVPVGSTIEFIVRGTILTKAITSEETKTQIEIIKAEQEEQNDNIETNANEIEALRQENALLRSQIPSGSVEEECITLKDSSNLPFDEFKIEGNSEQATRDGKNKFNVLDISSSAISDIDFNSSSFKMTNTWGETLMNSDKIMQNLKPNTTYKMSAKVTLLSKPEDITSTLNNNSILMSLYRIEPYGAVRILELSNIEDRKNWQINTAKEVTTTFTTPADLTDYLILSYSYHVESIGGQGSFKFENVMILEDTETDMSFEPYGVMPSTEFPSEIRNCGDDVNLFNKNAEVYKANNCTYTYENGIYTITNTNNKNPALFLKINLAKGNYILNSKKYLSDATQIRNSSETLLKTFANKYQDELFTLEEDALYIVFNWGTTTEPIILDLNTLKIQEGDVSTPYSPYNCGTINIEKCNKNFASTDIIKSLNKSVFTNITSNAFTVDLSQGSVSNLNLIDIMFGKLDGNKQYTLSYHLKQNNNTFNPKLAFYYTDGTYSAPAIFSSTEKDIVFTSTTGKTIERISFLWSTQTSSSLAEFSNIQLEASTTATPYVEHQGQTHTIYTQKSFRKVDNTRDIFINLGKWNERHYIKRLVLDGTETWHTGQDMGKVMRYYSSSLNLPQNTSTGMNNYFKWLKHYTHNSEHFYIGSDGYLYIFIDKETCPNTVSFKAYLAEQYANGTPMYIDFILAEPEDIECTKDQVNQLNELLNSGTYKNVTNICSLDEIKPTFEVKYRKDLETLLGGVANE